MSSVKLKNNVALSYKVFLCVMLISQIGLFFVECFIHGSITFIFSLILIIYFSIRLHVFLKVENLAKKSGMSMFDYMKKFEKENIDF